MKNNLTLYHIEDQASIYKKPYLVENRLAAILTIDSLLVCNVSTSVMLLSFQRFCNGLELSDDLFFVEMELQTEEASNLSFYD